MFLSKLKLWNFRKYGSGTGFNIDDPDLTVPFSNSLNVLIGENDSGKTAIVDAIKLVLKTHSFDWIRVSDDDFYEGTERLRVELLFEGISEEAYLFSEWLRIGKISPISDAQSISDHRRSGKCRGRFGHQYGQRRSKRRN